MDILTKGWRDESTQIATCMESFISIPSRSFALSCAWGYMDVFINSTNLELSTAPTSDYESPYSLFFYVSGYLLPHAATRRDSRQEPF